MYQTKSNTSINKQVKINNTDNFKYQETSQLDT